MMDEYTTELDRLKQLKFEKNDEFDKVKVILKDRIEGHNYDPNVYNDLKKLGTDPVLSNDLIDLRAGVAPTEAIDISSDDINVDSQYSYEMGRKVRYYRIYKEGNDRTNNALVYIHGGAFYGGDATDTIKPLKVMAEYFHGIIYSVDYSLSPEYPYPTGLFDCLAVLSKVTKMKRHVSISGDSSGGSLALGTSILSHNLGIYNVESQLLFYPTVVHGSNHQGTLWNDDKITIDEEQRPVLHSSYQLFEQLDTKMTKLYLSHENVDLSAPILSPLYADPNNFKKVTVLTGEFDPFRLQDEALVTKLGASGCDTTYIRYGGLGHAFLGLVGKVAAVEDAVCEAVKNM